MTDLQELLSAPAATVARRLLGCELIRQLDGQIIRLQIVETEAYDQTDAASHSYRGRTARTETMFGSPGRLYVYFTYGMHYCCNIVTGPEGDGAAVLVRAVQPLNHNVSALQQRRRGQTGVQLTNGPAKLCQALAIDKRLNGHDLSTLPLQLMIKPPLPITDIIQTTRVGISRAKSLPWRFYVRDNPYVSRLI